MKRMFRRLLRERGGDLSVAQRGARMGDTLIIDFDVFEQQSGKPIDGMEREKHELDCIDENNFLPGVMPHMMGMQVGEIKNFDFVFPDPWEPEHFAGLEATVCCLHADDGIKHGLFDLDLTFVHSLMCWYMPGVAAVVVQYSSLSACIAG